jgi:predicted SprT family Zn-dependent metalloprotease
MPIYDKEKMQVQLHAAACIWWEKALKIFGPKIGKMPPVHMNARLTSTAGRAFVLGVPQKCDFSCYLMEKYPEEFFADTIPHELAHIIAYRLHEDKGHGKHWKETATRLYGNCNTTHHMETLHAAKKRAGKC